MQMNIGFDAKRAFHNGTGLGHYSRSLIRALAESFPQHEYYLFNPKLSRTFDLSQDHLHEVLPNRFLSKALPALWRSKGVVKDLKVMRIGLYHGLSHEVPFGIEDTDIPAIVTMHDLIHERYPAQYKAIDRKIYTKKYKHACAASERVIAISEQTRADLIQYYQIPDEKIVVCYQSCNPSFGIKRSAHEIEAVKKLYKLPEHYLLSVGSIIERKNLLNVCKAYFILRNELDIPLVVIGNGGTYKQQVQDFVKQNNLEQKIIFLSDQPEAQHASFKNAVDFPAIYQGSLGMIYPSHFEGFGIPVLEALWSRIPVITSNVSCLPEAGGEGAFYVNPSSAEEIAQAIKTITTETDLVKTQTEKGWQHAQHFTPEKCAAAVMNVYQSVW